MIEPLGPDALPLQRNAHLVLTEPGAIRGNHYHEKGTEVTLALGPCLFRYRDDGEVHDLAIPEGQAYRITILPGVPHAFQNNGQGVMVLLGFNTQAHDPECPDVVREVLIEA